MARPLLLGRSAKETFLVDEVVDDRGRADEGGDGVLDACDRLTFVDGGGWLSVTTDSLAGEGR